jgi:hypothetical protein
MNCKRAVWVSLKEYSLPDKQFFRVVVDRAIHIIVESSESFRPVPEPEVTSERGVNPLSFGLQPQHSRCRSKAH